MIVRPKPNIAIVSIVSSEMLVFRFSVFKKLSPGDQIKRISNHISNTCHALELLETTQKISYQNWLVILPEYVITKAQSGSYLNIIPSDVRKIFKEEMKSLTSKFPKLTIIAGSIATAKTIRQNPQLMKERLDAIEAYYEDATNIMGPTNISTVQRGFIAGLQQLMQDMPHEITLVRNTAYKFSAGEGEFSEESHVKSFPATTELLTTGSMDTSVYQPGSKKSSPYFHLPNGDEPSIPIGIEICLDHNEGLLRQRALQNAMPVLPLHVVISNSTPLYAKHLYGEQVLQVDPDESHSLIRTKPESELSLNIDCFTTDFRQAGSITLIPTPTCNAIHVLCGSPEINKEELLIQLLHAGLDINERGGEDKFTPLHLAVVRSDILTVMLLLEHGADPTITDAAGRTPLELAGERANNIVVLNALTKAMDQIEHEKDDPDSGAPKLI